MTLIPGLVAAVLLVWALGGELTRLASLRFRRGMLLYVALGAQLVAFGPVRILGNHQVERVQLVTYGLLLAFCIANRRIPGLWLIALGVLANALVIAANGGAMPVDPGAIAASGWNLHDYANAYPNVAARAHASLWFLGDVFAMPRFPGSAVLSIGDVSIVAGVWLMLQRVTSRREELTGAPVPRRSALGLVTGGSAALFAGLGLIDGRVALLAGAIAAGAFLGLVALAVADRLPPPVRCLTICLLLATAAVLLAGSTGTLPTTILGTALAGLMTTIAAIAASRLLLRAPGNEFRGSR
jgi:hypothetical protein